MSHSHHTGGCLCGAVRYETDGSPLHVAICHCSLCRRSVGAAAVPWASFRRAGLRVVRGAPAWHRSSDHARRGFCPSCGTSLFFETTLAPDEVDVTVASLDAAAAVAPTHHIWVPDRLPWTTIDDGLPRYRRDTGSEPAE